MDKSSALTHASVGVVRSWFLEGGTGLSNIPSSSLIKAFFGIPGDTLTPITVTDGIVHSAGGHAFRSILVDKTVKGLLWTFTTDFNVAVTFSKVLNADKTGYLFKVDMITPLSSTQKQVRSLMQYSARGIQFFETNCVETVDVTAPAQENMTEQVAQPTKPTTPKSGFKFTTGEEQHDVQPAPKHAQPLSPVTRSEADAIAANTGTQAETAQPSPSPDGTEVGGSEASVDDDCGPIEEIDDEDDEEIEIDMTTEKITAFVKSLIVNLGEELSDDTLLAGFQYVFKNAETTIDRESTPAGKAVITVSDEGRKVSVTVDDWQKPSAIIEPAPRPETDPNIPSEPEEDIIHDKTIEVDGTDRCPIGVRISNKILNKAHDLLESNTIKNLVMLEDKLHEAFEQYDFNISWDAEKGQFHIIADTAEPDGIIERPEGISDSDWQAIKEGKTTVREVIKLNEAMAEADEDHKYSLEDLAGPVKYIGSFYDWDTIQKWYDENKASIDDNTGYLFRKVDSNQFFGLTKDRSWIDVSDSVNDIMRKEYDKQDEGVEEQTPPPPPPRNIVFNAETLAKEVVDQIVQTLHTLFDGYKAEAMEELGFVTEGVRNALERCIGPKVIEFAYNSTFDKETDTLTITETKKETLVPNIVIAGDDIVFTKGDEDEVIVHYNATRCEELTRFSDPDWNTLHFAEEGHYIVKEALTHEELGTKSMSDILEHFEYIPWETDTQKEETNVNEAEATELQETMSTDKNTQPITVDPNYIDLSDRNTRDRVIQVLFPGVIDPAITHLLNFLRDYHNEEQTPSYVATKTFPTETTIVYSNLTFSIVKMKEGRYWRIFCARTDIGLDDHTWLATKHIPNRWYQLGNDIANTTDFVRQNNGVSWRRKNNNA